jgi:hypothetical protein
MPRADYAASFAAIPNGARGAVETVSVSGVMLLSAMAVTLAILSAMALAATVLAIWWLVSHIPVPAPVWHLLTLLHLN